MLYFPDKVKLIQIGLSDLSVIRNKRTDEPFHDIIKIDYYYSYWISTFSLFVFH